MKRSIIKLLFTFSIIATSLLFIAISCDKGGLTKDDVNNLIASNNNSGNDGNSGAGSSSGNANGNNADGGSTAIGGGGSVTDGGSSGSSGGSSGGGSSGSSGGSSGSSGVGSVVTTGGDSTSTTLAGCTYRTVVPCIGVNSNRYSKTKKDPANPANENIIYINAAGIGAAVEPISDTSDANRGFHNPSADKEPIMRIYPYFPKSGQMFTSVPLMFINRTHVTTNTIALPATVDKTITQQCINTDGETIENNLATNKPEGSHCRKNQSTSGYYYTTDYLGTVFDNSDRTKARAMMACETSLYSTGNSGLTDSAVFTTLVPECSLIVVNDGRGKSVTIDDAWVGDPNSTTEMEFRIIAIDVYDKAISDFLPASDNFTAARFKQQIDNATFKKMLNHNNSIETTFKIKLVTRAVFDAL